MLLFGEGGPRDLTGAERLLKQAVEAGNAEAAHLLARHYEAGTFGERRPVDSIAFYRTAFRLGDATAGRALAKSLGLSTDSGRETADATVKRLERGVIEGKADAALVLGDLFRRGELVAEDPGEALKLYELAARLGSTEAYLRLARLHLSFGKGADGPEKAREWLLKGAEADNSMPRSRSPSMVFSTAASALTWRPRYSGCVMLSRRAAHRLGCSAS